MARRLKTILGIFTPREVLFMAIPLLAVASLHISKRPLWATLHLLGRDNGCSLERAMDSEARQERQNALFHKIVDASSMKVDKQAYLIEWTTPYGIFWAPPGTSVPFLIAEQKMHTYGDGARKVQKGDIVLDCGANIGTFTREALDAGAALVVAIEPSDRNVECLRRGFAKEIAEKRVIVYPKGVWHQEEVLEFNAYENSALDSLVMDTRTESTSKPVKIKVPVTTIDKIVAELGLEKVDFIKMDIEGAERNALKGGTNTIQSKRPRMAVATENLDDDPQVVPQVVRQLRPDYRQECGPCEVLTMTKLRPEILYFY